MPLWTKISSSQTQAAPLKLRHVHIWVKDINRTKAFYHDKLGLTVSNERPGEMVEFEKGALWFGKFKSAGPLNTEAITIGIEADPVDAAYQMLKERGVSIPKPPEKRSYGMSFSLKDPDGYAIEVEGPR